MEAFMEPGFRPQFAGHETFPLRALWLKKAYEAARNGGDRTLFSAADAIVRFGVGKNMAQSMRHWALAVGILQEESNSCSVTEFGRHLLEDESGLDPYLEHPASLWLIHLALAGSARVTTTWYWAFNIFGTLTFDRPTLVRGLLDLADQRGWKRVAPVTIRRDVDCFVRSYVARTRGAGAGAEDAIEPVLVELGLIRPSPIGDAFEFVRGPKPTLPDPIFAIALDRFWQDAHGEADTLSAEAACFGRGSPGRVFKLDEESVVDRLARIEEATDGAMRWSQTAGLRQVVRRAPLDFASALMRAYAPSMRLAA